MRLPATRKKLRHVEMVVVVAVVAVVVVRVVVGAEGADNSVAAAADIVVVADAVAGVAEEEYCA